MRNKKSWTSSWEFSIILASVMFVSAGTIVAQDQPPTKPAEQIIADLMAQGNLPALAQYAQAVVDSAREKNAIIEDMRTEMKRQREFVESLAGTMAYQQRLFNLQGERIQQANANYLKSITEERMQREKLVNDLAKLNKRGWRQWIGGGAAGAAVAGGTTGKAGWAAAGAATGFLLELIFSR